MPKTMLKKTNLVRKPLVNCHGGTGSLDFTPVLGKADAPGSRVNYIHDDVLKPGVSIGVHPHEKDTEFYYVVSGQGVMTLDGQDQPMQAGDISAVFPGGSHGLRNESNEELRIIVICVS